MSYPMPQYPPLTIKDQQATQALLDETSLSHWRVMLANGTASDPRSYYRAERQGPRAEVIHTEAEVLVALAAEADARLASLQPRRGRVGTRKHHQLQAVVKEEEMPNVRDGITKGPDRLGVTAEVARERAQIVRQTEASHGVPGDHVFASAEEIRRELFTPGATDIRSGLSYGDPVETRGADSGFDSRRGGKIALFVETYEAMRDELAELKRAPVREEHVENLVNAIAEDDVELVAVSWLSLTPRERTAAVEEGWVDEAEIPDLDELANRAHATLSQHAHAEAQLRPSVQAQLDQVLTYESMLAELRAVRPVGRSLVGNNCRSRSRRGGQPRGTLRASSSSALS